MGQLGDWAFYGAVAVAVASFAIAVFMFLATIYRG